MENTHQKPVELNVKGMTCTNCALSIERYLKKEGLSEVMVDFGSESVHFEIVDSNRVPHIIKGIEKLGFEVPEEELGSSPPENRFNWSRVEKLFAISLVFTLPLWLHMFLPLPLLHNPYFQFFLATPVFLLGLYYFGKSAWYSLKSGVANMDVLITLGITAAYGYSVYGLVYQLGPDFLFFETAAGIVTLVLLGNVIEHRSVKKTTSAIDELAKLQKSIALRLSSDPHAPLEEIEIGRLRVGDVLQVNSGDSMPADGVIVGGGGTADESMITGESMPQNKNIGDPVVGGTLLSSGNIQMKVSHLPKDSVLSHIIELVKKAQADKPHIQQLADRISSVFVPVVLGIAGLTFLVSYGLFNLSLQSAIIHSVAVLVIACPCAMGLATPTAVAVGIGRASRKGILIKGGRTLEQFSQVKQVVFDKTGTLTTGNFRIEEVHGDPADREELRSIAYSLSQASNHPLSVSVRKQWDGNPQLSLKSVVEKKGIGMEGQDFEGNHYQMGSHRMAERQTGDPSHSLYILKNQRLLGSIDMKDEIRVEARSVIAFLQEKGISPILLSGDRLLPTKEVAKELGIETVYAEQRPEDKLRVLETLRENGPTAMVGDGINDAPALAKADVGISVGQATQTAIQSAQIVLLKNDLTALTELFKVGKHTVRTIKQNLFWAFFYNVLAIPLAAIGLLSPLIGAITMALSDVVVIGNSLRLKVRKLN